MTDDELTAAQEAEAEAEPEAEPQPMPKRPTWQVVSWLGGVAVGGTLICASDAFSDSAQWSDAGLPTQVAAAVRPHR